MPDEYRYTNPERMGVSRGCFHSGSSSLCTGSSPYFSHGFLRAGSALSLGGASRTMFGISLIPGMGLPDVISSTMSLKDFGYGGGSAPSEPATGAASGFVCSVAGAGAGDGAEASATFATSSNRSASCFFWLCSAVHCLKLSKSESTLCFLLCALTPGASQSFVANRHLAKDPFRTQSDLIRFLWRSARKKFTQTSLALQP